MGEIRPKKCEGRELWLTCGIHSRLRQFCAGMKGPCSTPIASSSAASARSDETAGTASRMSVVPSMLAVRTTLAPTRWMR